MAKNVAQLLDLISQHLQIMKEEENYLITITNKIKKVEQPYRNILELRFIEGKKIEQIALQIDREYRYTKKLVKKSILKYVEI